MKVKLPSFSRIASLGSLPSAFRVDTERKTGIEITVCETVKEIGLHMMLYPHHVPETVTIEVITELVTVSAVTIGASLLNPENRDTEKSLFWNVRNALKRSKKGGKHND